MATLTLLLLLLFSIYSIIRIEGCRDYVWQKNPKIDRCKLGNQELTFSTVKSLALPAVIAISVNIVAQLMLRHPGSDVVALVISFWKPLAEWSSGISAT